MTRINVVNVKELPDEYLIAEYRELPRVVKQDINVDNAPSNYKLGEGHVKWARAHLIFILDRYRKLWREMRYRGFKTNYDPDGLTDIASTCNVKLYNDYTVTRADVVVNRQRLVEHYKRDFKWTKRHKPLYYYWNKLI